MATNNALAELNAMRREAKELGIEKPHTMKKDALVEAIAKAKAKFTHSCDRCGRRFEGEFPTWEGICGFCKWGTPDGKPRSEDPFDEIDPEVEGDHLDSDGDAISDARLDRDITREAWLEDAVKALVPVLAQAGATQVTTHNIKVSVGFPQGNVRKVVGQCHYAHCNDGVTHIFISPVKDDVIDVLGVLAHELIHADDQGASGHAGHFRETAINLGLLGDGATYDPETGKGGRGKMTATYVGPELRPVLEGIAEELGEYPHTRLNLGEAVTKKQSTRMLKLSCTEVNCLCGGYVVRTTRKWIEVGTPTCPGGFPMTAEDKGETESE